MKPTGVVQKRQNEKSQSLIGSSQHAEDGNEKRDDARESGSLPEMTPVLRLTRQKAKSVDKKGCFPRSKGQTTLETQTGDVWQTANALPYKYACVQILGGNKFEIRRQENAWVQKRRQKERNLARKGRAQVQASAFVLFEYTWSPR